MSMTMDMGRVVPAGIRERAANITVLPQFQDGVPFWCAYTWARSTAAITPRQQRERFFLLCATDSGRGRTGDSVRLRLPRRVCDQLTDVFSPPGGAAWRQLYRLRIAPRLDTFPPAGFAHRENA